MKMSTPWAGIGSQANQFFVLGLGQLGHIVIGFALAQVGAAATFRGLARFAPGLVFGLAGHDFEAANLLVSMQR